MRERVLEYYWVLRSVLRQKPDLRRYGTRCRHCGIFFLTYPQNAGRRDLGCPFGCARAHRRRRSTERSTAYYRTESGKMKKKRQNGKRGRRADSTGAAAERSGRAESLERDPRAGRELEEEAVGPQDPEQTEKTRRERSDPPPEVDEGMAEHIRMMTSLIEDREVSREEALELIRRVMRQPSLGGEKRIDYLLRYLEENPP